MPATLFESSAKLLVLLHAVAAIVLIGSTTHHSVIALSYLRRRHDTRLGRIYAATSLVAFSVTFVLGAIAYPTYRYHVRDQYLDRSAVWASNLFELKENFAALALPMVIGAFVVSRSFDPKAHRTMIAGYITLVAVPALIVWFDVIAGLLVTMTKGV